MFKIYYLWGRKKVSESVKKEIAKYDKKEAEKIKFAEIEEITNEEITKDNISNYIGKKYRPDQAINALVQQLEAQEGNIYLTRLDVDQLLEKAKKIAILSYSDYVNRVNTKLLVALDTGQPYREFIKLLKADQIVGTSLKSMVDVKGYWSTVYRTNIGTIFQAGYADQLEELKEFIYAEEYVAVIGVHPTCKAQNGEIRERGGFEATGTAPINGYNCTGYLNIISKIRAKALGIKAKPKSQWSNVKPPEGFGGKTTVKKSSTLPKKTEKRLPKGYKKFL